MKTTLRAKLLQHLASKKKANEGFTLIELLVVIIIIGILAAIALPSFLNQANRARQTEAVTNVGAINRGQQAYVLDEAVFSRFISGLGVGIRVESDNYEFGQSATAGDDMNIGDILGLNAGGTFGFNTGAGGDADDMQYQSGALVYAAPAIGREIQLRGYAGATYLLSEENTGEVTSTTLLCEENQAGMVPQEEPTLDTDADGLVTDTTCGNDSTEQ